MSTGQHYRGRQNVPGHAPCVEYWAVGSWVAIVDDIIIIAVLRLYTHGGVGLLFICVLNFLAFLAARMSF
jgi:hypothetical protein